MKTKAAILFEVGKRLDLREVELDPPRMGEVMIKIAAAGVCHSKSAVYDTWRLRGTEVWARVFGPTGGAL